VIGFGLSVSPALKVALILCQLKAATAGVHSFSVALAIRAFKSVIKKIFGGDTFAAPS